MNEERTIKALLSLRKLHETRAMERLGASEAALRVAENDTTAARTDHKQHMLSTQQHEQQVIGSLANRVMSPRNLQDIQESLDAFKDHGQVLAKRVAKAQSAVRARANELKAAQDHLKQKQRDHLKLENYDTEMDQANELRDTVMTENEDAERAQTASQYQLKPI